MNRRHRVIPLLALGMLLYHSPSRLRAEIVCAGSIEWIVASSDIVVRGTIVEVVRDQGFFVDEVWDRVTIQVVDTLKGDKQKKIDFVTRLSKPVGGPQPAGLQVGKTEFLFFLVRSDKHRKHGPKRFADCDLTPRPYTDVFDLTVKDALWFATMDFKIVAGTDKVLEGVRALALAQGEKELKQTSFGVPWNTEAYKKLWQGSGVSLTVPVDGRLEKLAGEWYRSKDLEYRLLGLLALREFKSEENIRLMKNLLRNPESWEGTTNNRRYRYYPLRQAAYEALKAWGIEAQKPVTEEPLDGAKQDP